MRHLLVPGAVLSGCLLSGCSTPGIDVDGVHVHYSRAGQGDRTLVFVHGWASDATVWSEQIPALTDLGRLIAIDLPGHGRSDEPATGYSMAYWARCVAAVLDAEGIDRAVLVGHSNGAPVIRSFYQQFPARTEALVTIDGALLQVVDPALAAPFIERLRGPQYREFIREMTSGMTRLGTLDAAQRQQLLEMALRTPQRVALGGLLAATDPAAWPPLRVEVPLLVVNVPQPTWNEDYRQRLRAMAPRLRYHEVAGANHFVMLDRPAEFHALLRAFLQELDR